MIEISVQNQELVWYFESVAKLKFSISTAAKGTGQEYGSFQTPLGEHYITAKIGSHLPIFAVLKGRRWTGEIYTEQLGQLHPKRDWILSRIIWLQGCQPGFNRGGRCDSRRRYIYIHGTDEEHLIGQPHSHGCIRMTNRDVITLYDVLKVGEKVIISS